MANNPSDQTKAPGFTGLGVLAGGGLILGATLLAYLPALPGEFLWNDRDYVTAPALRSLAGLGRIWAQPGATEQYYPLLHSFFWLQHRLWGDHPLGYHLATLLLHVSAAVLFALCLRRLAVPGAWLAAAIFALHPVHVESVAWIAEQKNTLSLVFYLGAALAYFQFDATRQPRAYGMALGLFLLALLGKTVTASLPAALLVIFWWQRGRLEWRRDVRPLVAWLALGAAAGLFSSWVERHYLGATGAEFTLALPERVLVAGRAVFFYLGSLLWPARLMFIYPRWQPDAAAWRQWLFPAAVLALAVALWLIRQRTRAPFAALLFFTGSLFPVLGFVNLYGAVYAPVWDHWQYLPDLAPVALIAAGLTLGWQRATIHPRWAGPALGVILMAALGGLTAAQCLRYRDPVAFYQAILADNPDSWFAHTNLGNLLSAAGQPAAAAGHYEHALRVKPDYPEAQNDLGLALARLGRTEEAISHYEEAVQLQPDYAAAHNNLAGALLTTGRNAPAIAHYRTTLRLDPGSADAAYNFGFALRADGRPAEAITVLENLLRRQPEYAAGWNCLGLCLADLHRPGEAVAAFERALRMRPDFPEALNNLGDSLQALGRTAEAIPRYEKALQLMPGAAAVHINLGIALVQTGRPAEGLAHLEKAVQLSPALPAAQRNLAVALRLAGREREAAEHEAVAAKLELTPVRPGDQSHP